MLNHTELQGQIENVRRGENKGRVLALFDLVHTRAFSTETDRFSCIIPADWAAIPFLGAAKDGRTVIITGRLRTNEQGGGVEIVCETADFVDGRKRGDGS